MNNQSNSNMVSIALYIAAAFMVGLGTADLFSACYSAGNGWLAASGILLFVIGGILDWICWRMV